MKIALTSWNDPLQTLLLERVDLEKDVKNMFQELVAMESQQNKEKEDFEEAKEEMDQAIAAVEKAVKLLGEATKDHKEGRLLQAKVGLSEGFAERTAEAQALQHAVELGECFLGKGDALCLRRVQTGEVPEGNFEDGVQGSFM